MQRQVILLHPDAPRKPRVADPCNGCGACCAAEPCPLGVLISRRRTGSCAALAWDDASGRYRCGAASAPERHLPWLPASWARRLALRWISAGSGCDADFHID
jgi:hypothetical protein